MGPFFRRLGRELQAHGATISKINLNAGDSLFYNDSGAVSFRGTLEEWPDFLADFIQQRGIDIVVLFGDRRAYHEPVQAISTRLGCRLYVFEEGYLRPNYITVELGGVNGRSLMPRHPEGFSSMPSVPLKEPRVRFSAFYHGALFAMLYHGALTLAGWRYPHYRHHRAANGLYQAFAWIRAGVRKQWFRIRERNVVSQLHRDHSGRYFVVPLQVRDDAQIRCYSDYDNIESFIEEVAFSFAEHAAPEDCIVFKHHPMDRGYSDYTRFIDRLRAKTGLGRRLFYVHDVPMPQLLRRTKGAVMVNSTTGISALHHGVPVKLLGEAVYDIEGLTSKAALADFWREPGKVDRKLYVRFRNWLLSRSQAQGTFYRRVPGINTPTGIDWDPVSLTDAQVTTAPEHGETASGADRRRPSAEGAPPPVRSQSG